MKERECIKNMWIEKNDEKMSCVRMRKDKMKKLIIRRKWKINVVIKRKKD
jgi:hypothetical protein